MCDKDKEGGYSTSFLVNGMRRGVATGKRKMGETEKIGEGTGGKEEKEEEEEVRKYTFTYVEG